MNVQVDHVQLVAIIPPRLSVASAIQYMESQSSKKLRERFEFIQKAMRRGGIWPRGYWVSTVGMNEEMILRYVVEHQGKEDKGQLTFDFGK